LESRLVRDVQVTLQDVHPSQTSYRLRLWRSRSWWRCTLRLSSLLSAPLMFLKHCKMCLQPLDLLLPLINPLLLGVELSFASLIVRVIRVRIHSVLVKRKLPLLPIQIFFCRGDLFLQLGDFRVLGSRLLRVLIFRS